MLLKIQYQQVVLLYVLVFEFLELVQVKKGLFLFLPHLRIYLIDYDLVSKWKKNPTEVQISIDEWAKEEKISKDALWAIRSSADAEDGADQSFAGIYTTICNVKTKDLLSAIKTVLNDYQAIDSKANLDDKSIGFGIIIQKMVQSDYSGVIFFAQSVE